ncbi:MAG: Txe/YoeB family addiction module toxin [Chlorobiaceae bacterium]
MGYTLIYTDNALEDIDWLKKSGDKACLKKLAKLLEELIEHPFTGTGQPEQLKFDFSGCWSRRIEQKASTYLPSGRKEGNSNSSFSIWALW